MDSFVGIGLGDGILKAIKDLGFEKPTPIQAKAIPHLLESKQHLIGSAQTGTGKTGAFGLPSVHLADTSKKHTQTMILSPTRELCLQITKDLQNYAKYVDGLTILAVYGGANIDPQIRTLKKGAQIVVATPGRAVDLIKRKKLKLGDIDRLILDEADEMLTMGFKDDLDFIIEQTPEERQIILFSATMSQRIKGITKSYMTDAVELATAKVNMGASTVEHLYYTVSAKEKYEVLKRVADMNPDIYGIVFCRTRRETKEIANKLIGDGYNADALHGDLSQAQRDEVMNRFRVRHLQMLVATDVASRGLDVDDLTHVINYNLPDDIEAYVHRSGRTGRAGKKGISIAIVNSREKKRIRDIERTSKITFAHTPVPTGKEICSKQLYSLIEKIEKVEVDEKEIEPFLPEIYEKLEALDREQIIKHFVYSEFNRFLDYYKDAPDLNRKG
ncbi:MAG: DEAD/DEAH box helicase, partial [Bacteroidota bacterium]